MYKKIRASGDLVPVNEKCSSGLREELSPSTQVLVENFREELKKDKLQDIGFLALPADTLSVLNQSGRVTHRVPSKTIKAGCFYKTENNQVVFVEKLVPENSSIDLIEISCLERNTNG
jgi:hypothetical protein